MYGADLKAINAYGDGGDRKYTGTVSIGIGFSY
jgi:hypothetical protein